MTQLILDATSNDFLINAATTSVTVTSPVVKFTNFVSGIVSLDALGSMSVLSGSLFSASANYSVSGTWTFSNTVTFSSAVINSGISAQAGVLGVPTKVPPSGYSHVIINNTTKQIYMMT